MSDAVQKVIKIVNYWYMRYLVATELYMVEPWEKVVIHVLFIIFFGLFWYFNNSIILNGLLQLKDSTWHTQTI